MKQIISEKLYDTETATKLASTTEQSPSVEVSLYRKTNGEYFIEYRDKLIQPLSLLEAKDWVGKYNVDLYITIFGAVSE
jgi:hypothetical protein